MKTITVKLEVRDLFSVNDLFQVPTIISANYVAPSWGSYTDEERAIALLCVAQYPHQKITAIKTFQACTGWYLRECKDIIETAFTQNR